MAPNGAMTTRPFPLRILVHSEVVGAIIGRSGSTIRNITQQTKARIDVHREESPEQQEKVITINGQPDNCSAACFKIIEVVQNEITAKFEGNPDPNRDITLKILASSNLIGRLIGKSGSTIKKMMEQTSTRINISTNNITETTGEHTIQVVGKLEQVRQAERLISAKLRAAFQSDMNISLHNMSQSPYLFNNVLLPYMPNPYTQNSILASIVNPQAAGGHRGQPMPRSMHMTPSHQGQMYAAPGYLPLYPNPSNVAHQAGAAAAGLMGFNPVAPGFEQERETVYVYIPSSMVGAIIGKSGAAIKEMISTSGASIKVATAPPPSAELQRNDQQHQDEQDGSLQKPVPDEPELNNNDATTPTQTKTTTTTTNTPAHKTTYPKSKLTPTQATQTASTLTTTTSSPSSNDEPTTNGNGPHGSDDDSTQAPSSTTTNPQVSRYPNGSNDPQTTRKVTIVGYPASQYSAQYMIFRKIAMESGKGDISLMVELSVPSQFVGKIIGKGGATVKTLQKQTRTTIRLPEDKSSVQSQSHSSNGCGGGGGGANGNNVVANNSETCVQITGEFEGSQAAQRHIKNLIRDGNAS